MFDFITLFKKLLIIFLLKDSISKRLSLTLIPCFLIIVTSYIILLIKLFFKKYIRKNNNSDIPTRQREENETPPAEFDFSSFQLKALPPLPWNFFFFPDIILAISHPLWMPSMTSLQLSHTSNIHNKLNFRKFLKFLKLITIFFVWVIDLIPIFKYLIPIKF